MYADRHDGFRSRPDSRDFHHGSRHDFHSYRPAPYAYRPYYHRSFAPVWYGPVVYPASSFFGLSWSSGSFGISVAAYSSPAYCYSRTRYYDSWSCGGWGYSSVYYGGWRNNWYGGFSYVYNPWPVYRTYYLYDPPPVVTSTEIVYVTPPATTTFVVQNPAAAPAVQQLAASPAPPLQPQTAWDAAPAAERVETAAERCFCACRCNGQRACTCEYPCGSEYAVVDEQFDLSLAYRSYAESLSPEMIWSSYAGLDRQDSFEDSASLDVAVSSDPRDP